MEQLKVLTLSIINTCTVRMHANTDVVPRYKRYDMDPTVLLCTHSAISRALPSVSDI